MEQGPEAFAASMQDGRGTGLTRHHFRACARIPSGSMSDEEMEQGRDAVVERLRALTNELESLASDRGLISALSPAERTRLLNAAGDLYEPDVARRRQSGKAARRRAKASKLERDEAVLSETGIRVLRRKPVFTTPNVFPPSAFEQEDVDDDPDFREVVEPQHCYVCKQQLRRDPPLLRPAVPGVRATFNFAQAHRDSPTSRARRAAHRRAREDRLPGRPQAAARRRAADRHHALPARLGGALRAGAGLRASGAIGSRSSASTCATRRASRRSAASCWRRATALDFIINNACQTVRRPPEFYAHMMEGETAALHGMPEHVRRLLGAYEGLRGYRHAARGGASAALDARGIAEAIAGADARGRAVAGAAAARGARWRRSICSPRAGSTRICSRSTCAAATPGGCCWPRCSTVELLEVQLVNAVAPFILNARLKPLMLRTPERDKHIVNVSAVEGQFYRNFKTTRHPHTNMAKAALNMMTRTSAADYHDDGIHMNSVDTGWVTDEDPAEIAARKTAEHRFHPPLDIVDGAARIVDPIIDGLQHRRRTSGASS